MPKFQITSPEGQKFEVEGPDGSSEADALSHLQQQMAAGASYAPEDKSLTGTIKEAASNVIPSAIKFGTDLVQPVLHPIDTIENVGALGKGVLQKLGVMSGDDSTKYADAVGKFFVDRYGSLEAARNTLAKDPVGLAGDLSMVLTGGETALARIPGLAGRVGEIMGTVGRSVDPLSVVAKTAQGAGTLASEAVGATTFAGGQALRTAAQAGYDGGDAAKAFRDNIKGASSMDDVVNEAKAAVGQIRKERGDVYRQDMAKIGADNTVLDFTKIDNAVQSVNNVKNYKGQSLSPKTQAIRDEMSQAVADWKALDPAEFHTAEGLDALKQKIGDIRDATQYGTPERVVADSVYQGVRRTIIDQAPDYAKVMKGYEEASKQIKEIEKTLSLNPNATVDTSLRKLQSVLRDNVNTSYGKRAELAKFLVDSGASNLMYKLAGQALHPIAPRGLGKLAAVAGGEGAAALAGVTSLTLPGLAAAAAPLTVMSPRLMGNTSYLAGRAASLTKHIPLRAAGRASFQAGRLPQ